MKQEETITIRNTSSTVVACVYDTEGAYGPKNYQYLLQPGEVRTIPNSLAKIFLDQCPKTVKPYVHTGFAEIQGEEKIWLANATGNPFLPEQIEVVRVEKGRKIKTMVPNPLRTPMLLRRVSRGGQLEVKDAAGQPEQLNLMPFTFEFPPYMRLPVSKTYADWCMRREANQVEGWKKKLIVSREPLMFEPSESWALGHLQCYAALLGQPALLERHDIVGKPAWAYKSLSEVAVAADTLRRALYFFIIRPEVALPPQGVFEAALETFENDQAANWCGKAWPRKASVQKPA